jgi:addiction module HigA family antidote
VSELLLGKRSMSPEMAARDAKQLRGTPEIWLRMQAARDLWEIDQDVDRLADVRPIDKRVLEAA